jgi:hypothetical protein
MGFCPDLAGMFEVLPIRPPEAGEPYLVDLLQQRAGLSSPLGSEFKR